MFCLKLWLCNLHGRTLDSKARFVLETSDQRLPFLYVRVCFLHLFFSFSSVVYIVRNIFKN